MKITDIITQKETFTAIKMSFGFDQVHEGGGTSTKFHQYYQEERT